MADSTNILPPRQELLFFTQISDTVGRVIPGLQKAILRRRTLPTTPYPPPPPRPHIHPPTHTRPARAISRFQPLSRHPAARAPNSPSRVRAESTLGHTAAPAAAVLTGRASRGGRCGCSHYALARITHFLTLHTCAAARMRRMFPPWRGSGPATKAALVKAHR